eukprot:1136290-Pelagomonas_calceolata.AAC.2
MSHHGHAAASAIPDSLASHNGRAKVWLPVAPRPGKSHWKSISMAFLRQTGHASHTGEASWQFPGTPALQTNRKSILAVLLMLKTLLRSIRSPTSASKRV